MADYHPPVFLGVIARGLGSPSAEVLDWEAVENQFLAATTGWECLDLAGLTYPPEPTLDTREWDQWQMDRELQWEEWSNDVANAPAMWVQPERGKLYRAPDRVDDTTGWEALVARVEAEWGMGGQARAAVDEWRGGE